jgi:hypothetical protein
VANPRKLFRKTMAAAVFRWNRAPPHHCREKTWSCRKKKRALVLPTVRRNEITCG